MDIFYFFIPVTLLLITCNLSRCEKYFQRCLDMKSAPLDHTYKNNTYYTMNNVEREHLTMKSILQWGVCMGWGNWKIDKKFGCSSPELSENTILEYPCQCNFGGMCKAKCKQNLHIEEYIYCNNDGTWTKILRCPISCLLPILPPNLVLIQACSAGVGETCRIKCAKDFVLIGNDTIQCLKTGKWSKIPKCVPLLRLSTVLPPN
ncbi:P-selectin-like [Centruroides sculpturatus]|uniref:P-selectin-like n=1 Tax=Centruroides sculpturatus TaxID=218467 RepID=UPI000C6EB80E|nr:P-selectin-like [Centruroides sculpturatus]